MYRKIRHRVRYSLYCLVAILSIALGMPLLHPGLHSHSVHHNTIAGHGTYHYFDELGSG